ncbi:MAG: hypothetical protein V2J12_01470 [Gammaproteobacteria bacterium]|jgi:hypothetical protein|nr:hypothetical protein [Gammaproteobacteria bacterium]
MRKEVEAFGDGTRTVREYDAADRVCRLATYRADGELKASIDYHYDAAGVNVERVLRDATGAVLRTIRLDAAGTELDADPGGPVRWRSLDGEAAGEDEKGQEQISPAQMGGEADYRSS